MRLEKIIPENFKLLISEEQIRVRLVELGEQITADFENENPVLIGVLNGGFIFLADLIRHIPLDLEIDFIRISRDDGLGFPRQLLEHASDWHADGRCCARLEHPRGSR